MLVVSVAFLALAMLPGLAGKLNVDIFRSAFHVAALLACYLLVRRKVDDLAFVESIQAAFEKLEKNR